ncbi:MULTISPECIES: hypothetical protein [Bacillaceae]|uniref:hypothetical protein n=1 Tax=Bacillaceae TaxID=186817 RepID=UPI000C34EC88|nr:MULTISPECIES: hypothetical protein [Bacillaceae]MCT4478042.1 hypothetical protein [Peribacillus frigoritolerans]PKF86588.1 hypothetical protein CW306_20770 [Bacillus sp. BA3]CAH0129478.1 hypothetical protein SRABI134_00242 [Peribacillus sp. Bi134]
MKINFTKKQYETLFKMVQYGYWVASDIEDNKEEFSEMEQYINSFAKDFGVEGVQFVKEYEIYDLTRELEDRLQTVINEYEEGVFRDKLAYHLARKEFAEESENQEYNQEEAFIRIMELEEKYHLHIEERGLGKLKMEE